MTLVGGIAMLLPPQPVDAGIAERVMAAVDALIITGGRDLDPAAYGHDPHPASATNRPGIATPGSSLCWRPRCTAGCPCWAFAVERSC